MEFRLLVDGDPVTDWEQVRARDVGLWKRTTAAALGIRVTEVVSESRKIGAPDPAAAVGSMTKAQLVDHASDLGIDIPTGATKAQIVDLIE